MSTAEAANKRRRVGGDEEAGGEAGAEMKAGRSGGDELGGLELLSYAEAALFPEVASYLSCQDMLALGSVDKERRKAYVANESALLEPTLEVLESMCRSNCTCGDKYEPNFGDHPEISAFAELDPRYEDYYEGLPTRDKVKEMVEYLGTIEDATDAANPKNMPEVIGNHPGGNWSCGLAEDAILKLYPRRAALAFNIALASYARSEMDEGGDSYFNDAFLGIGDIDPGGSSFGHAICDEITKMLPFSDEAFVEFMRREILPSTKIRSALGPALTERLVLCAPFDDWLDGDGDLLLPAGLEPYDAAAAQSAVEELEMQVKLRRMN